MKRTWSTAALALVGIGAFIVGFIISTLLKTAQGPTQAMRRQIKAVINLDSHDNSCQQFAGSDFGHVVKYAFPVLTKGGDSIVWHGQVDGGSPNQKVEVQFPPNYTPFASSTFSQDQDSGPVNASAAMGDYPFASASVGGTPCSSFKDPGVHVN